LYHLLESHFDHFEQIYDERFDRDYGFYRPVISDVVRAYLKCGDLKQGFARVRCPDCHYEYMLAFSCRGRWFCPSCHAKKVVQFGEVLRENILYPVPHRQYVFSIPIILRKFFLYNRSLLSELTKCAADSLLSFLRTALGLEDGICGAVITIQTFGDYANWHPHIHSIVADGLFRRNGVFYVKNFQLVRYFGWYSNRMRGEREKQELEERKTRARITKSKLSMCPITNRIKFLHQHGGNA